MLTLTGLKNFLDTYMNFDKSLPVAKIDLFMANGLMVKGADIITKIGFGVSASLALFDKASKNKCDTLIVHHAFNFPPYNTYDSIFQNRISFLINKEISLFGFHYLLDAHPEVGNNIQILKAVDCRPTQPYEHHGNFWGWEGEYKKDRDLEDIKKKLLPKLSSRTVIYPYGPKIIKKVVAVSGKGAPSPSDMQRLIDFKIDLYITGEVHEWNRELFREARIHLIAGGHYATEVFGIKALMEKVQHQFPQIKTVWLEVYNEI